MLILLTLISLLVPVDNQQDLLAYVIDDSVSYVQYWDLESIGKLDEDKRDLLIHKPHLGSSYFLRITEQIPKQIENLALRKVVAFNEFIVASSDTDQGLEDMEEKSRTAKMNPYKMLYSTKDGPFLFYIGRKSRIIYELNASGDQQIKQLLKKGLFTKTESEGIFRTRSQKNTRDLFYTWLPDLYLLLASETTADLEDLKAKIYQENEDEKQSEVREIFTEEQLEYMCSFSDMNIRYQLARSYSKENYTSSVLAGLLAEGQGYMSAKTQYVVDGKILSVVNELEFNNSEVAKERYARMNIRKTEREEVKLVGDGKVIVQVKKFSDDYIKTLLHEEKDEVN